MIYVIRKPNYQSDRIWTRSMEDINDDEKYREMVQNTRCIGIFVMFTTRKLLWVLKKSEQSWDSVYFRKIILQKHVLPFPRNSINIFDKKEIVFLHDKTPCMQAYTIQHFWKDEGLNF